MSCCYINIYTHSESCSCWAVVSTLSPWLSLPLAYILLYTVARSNTHLKRPPALSLWSSGGELCQPQPQLWKSSVLSASSDEQGPRKRIFRKQWFPGMRRQHVQPQKHLMNHLLTRSWSGGNTTSLKLRIILKRQCCTL